MAHTIYRESEWYEWVDCQRVYDKPDCTKDDCDGCMEFYNDLKDSVIDDFMLEWENKGYEVDDIWESDLDRHKIQFVAKLVKTSEVISLQHSR